MDVLDPLSFLLEYGEDELEIEEEEKNAALVMLSSMVDARQRRQEQRAKHRLYLTRPDLAQHPRDGTPWHALYQNQHDRAFITTMGIDVATFHYILNSGFANEWNTFTIPRNDTNFHGVPRIRRRSLDAAGALGLCLHYLNSTAPEFNLQQIFSLIPSTVTRYITFALDLLLLTLRRIFEALIIWPRSVQEFRKLAALVAEHHPFVQGAFGFIDGLNLPVQVHGDDTIQNSTYNGWLHSHFISNVLVFSPEGM